MLHLQPEYHTLDFGTRLSTLDFSTSLSTLDFGSSLHVTTMEFMANLQGGLDELKPSLFGTRRKLHPTV